MSRTVALPFSPDDVRRGLTARKLCPTCCGRGNVLDVPGEALRKLRTDRGWGLNETARHIGLTAPYLSDIERGKRRAVEHVVAAYIALDDRKAAP